MRLRAEAVCTRQPAPATYSTRPRPHASRSTRRVQDTGLRSLVPRRDHIKASFSFWRKQNTLVAEGSCLFLFYLSDCLLQSRFFSGCSVLFDEVSL